MIDAFTIQDEENGTKNIFREKYRRKKVSLIFLDVKVLTKRYQLHFLTLATRKQGTVYEFSV